MTQPKTSGTSFYTARKIFYAGVLILLTVLVAGWLQHNIATLQAGGGTALISIARLMGLLAGFAVLLQVFLMSRVPLVDQRFNLHEIVRLHRWNGYSVVAFISAHVLLMTAGYSALSDTGMRVQFVQLITTYQDVFKAFLAVILIFTAVFISIGAARRRVAYEVWYYVHLMLYVAILLALFHQINIGGDMLQGDWFRYFWIGLYVFVFGIWSYYRGARIVLQFIRHRFRVAEIVQEADGIYSVYITGRKLDDFKYDAGQYAGWRFLGISTALQSHPYSFSLPRPVNNRIRFSINTSDGKFTQNIPRIKPGTPVLVDGPRGSFVTKRASTNKVVLVAGGIGLAPYMSLIPELLTAGHTVTLLYAVRSHENAAYGKELKQLLKQGLELSYFMSSDNQRIGPDTIQKHAAGGKTTFYLCGPDGMVNALRLTIQELDVPAERVITERFNV